MFFDIYKTNTNALSPCCLNGCNAIHPHKCSSYTFQFPCVKGRFSPILSGSYFFANPSKKKMNLIVWFKKIIKLTSMLDSGYIFVE